MHVEKAEKGEGEGMCLQGKCQTGQKVRLKMTVRVGSKSQSERESLKGEEKSDYGEKSDCAEKKDRGVKVRLWREVRLGGKDRSGRKSQSGNENSEWE